jgi:hypothetical protein
VLCAIGGEVRRCHDCRVRQVWFGPAAFRLPGDDAAAERLTSVAVGGSAFVVCFLVIWWMISRFTELAG